MEKNVLNRHKTPDILKKQTEYIGVTNKTKNQYLNSPRIQPKDSFQDQIDESQNEERDNDDIQIPTEKCDDEIIEDLYTYTSKFFNKKRSYCVYWITICSLAFHVGAIFSFHAAITMIYLDDGMDVKYKIVLNFLSFPFLILPIYGAIIDTNFIKNVGKSKTYLAIQPIIYCSLLIFYSFFIDEWLQDLNVWGFFGVYFMVNTFIAIYLSAIDAWIPLAFTEEEKAKGSFSRQIGFSIGSFISYNLFILLNSDKWCKDYLGLERNIITKNTFQYFVIIYCSLSSLLVFLFVAERVDKKPKVKKIRDIWEATKQIIKKRGTKVWMLVMMFKSFGIDLCLQIITTVLVDEGLDKEVLVMANFVSGVPILIGMIILQKCIKTGTIMKRLYQLVWLGIPVMFIDVYTYYDFKNNGDKNTFYFSTVSNMLGGILKTTWWVYDTAQFAIMVDENINSTHWAAMQTFQNITNSAPYFVSTILLPFIGYYIISITGFVYTIIVLPFLWKYFKELDACNKDDFIWKDSVLEAFEESKKTLKDQLENNKDELENKNLQIARKPKRIERLARNKILPKNLVKEKAGSPYNNLKSKQSISTPIRDNNLMNNNSNLSTSGYSGFDPTNNKNSSELHSSKKSVLDKNERYFNFKISGRKQKD